MKNKGIKVSQMAKITTPFPRDHWIKKRGNYLTAKKRERDMKDTHRNTQNAALNVDLF